MNIIKKVTITFSSDKTTREINFALSELINAFEEIAISNESIDWTVK